MPAPNYAALLAAEGLSPRNRAQMMRLLGGPDADVAAQPASETAAETAPPVPQPDPYPGVRGPYPGVLPGSAPSGAAALLRSPEPAGQTPETPQQKMRRFEETTGGRMALDLLEKRKKLPWFLPDAWMNRNERATEHALRIAQMEMGGDEAAARTNEGMIERADRRLESERRYQTFLMSDENEDLNRVMRGAQFETEAELSRKRLSLDEQKAKQDADDAAAAKAHRERVLALQVRQEDRLGSEKAQGVPSGVAAELTRGFMSDPDLVQQALPQLEALGIVPKGAGALVGRAPGAPGAPARVFRRGPDGKLVKVQ